MTLLEKCLELAEDYAVKKQMYNHVRTSKSASPTEIRDSFNAMDAAKRRYIHILSKIGRDNLHKELTDQISNRGTTEFLNL